MKFAVTARRLLTCVSALILAIPAVAQEGSATLVHETAATVQQSPAASALVSAADVRAAEAGRAVLQQGGSAADAAMATMLALTVVEPQSSGIGGGGFFVYNDVSTGHAVTINGRETAPRAARPGRFLDAQGRPRTAPDAIPGGLSVGVPGNVRLMAEVHRRYGKLPWARLFDPAIRLAEEGYEVSPWLDSVLRITYPTWQQFPEIRAIYTIDGRAARRGERIRNPQLAALLRDIQARGPDAFYRGETARAIVRATTTAAPRNPGDMTLADLAAYQAVSGDAVCFNYRVYRLCGMGPPSSGATTVFQILGLLESFDLHAMGPDNPMSWHLMAEAMRIAYADRDAYVGDPDFVQVPLAGMLDKDYLAQRSRLISPFTALGRVEPGRPESAEPRTAAPGGEVPSTSHFVAVDAAGNVASMTSTVEGFFGSQLVARGMVLNNELTDFSFEPERNGAPVANRVQPGKRPRSSMAPTIVYGPDGRPMFAVGSAGGPRIIMHVAKTLIGVLDFGLSPRDAIALPNLYMAGDGDVIENTPMGQRLAPQIARFGRTMIATDLPSKVNAAIRAPDGQGWIGAADPRSVGGVALVE